MSTQQSFSDQLAIVDSVARSADSIDVIYNQAVTFRALEAVRFYKNGKPLPIRDYQFKGPEAGAFRLAESIVASDIITLSSTNPEVRSLPIDNSCPPDMNDCIE